MGSVLADEWKFDDGLEARTAIVVVTRRSLDVEDRKIADIFGAAATASQRLHTAYTKNWAVGSVHQWIVAALSV